MPFISTMNLQRTYVRKPTKLIISLSDDEKTIEKSLKYHKRTNYGYNIHNYNSMKLDEFKWEGDFEDKDIIREIVVKGDFHVSYRDNVCYVFLYSNTENLPHLFNDIIRCLIPAPKREADEETPLTMLNGDKSYFSVGYIRNISMPRRGRVSLPVFTYFPEKITRENDREQKIFKASVDECKKSLGNEFSKGYYGSQYYATQKNQPSVILSTKKLESNTIFDTLNESPAVFENNFVAFSNKNMAKVIRAMKEFLAEKTSYVLAAASFHGGKTGKWFGNRNKYIDIIIDSSQDDSLNEDYFVTDITSYFQLVLSIKRGITKCRGLKIVDYVERTTPKIKLFNKIARYLGIKIE